MKRLAMVTLIMGIFLLGKVPMVSAQIQFAEAGVEKFRVPVDAPDFTLREVGGGKISLKESRGKVILLNFFASW